MKVVWSSRLARWQAAIDSESHRDVIKFVRFWRCWEHIQADCSNSKALFSTSSLRFWSSCFSELINIFSRLNWFANSAIFIHPSDVDCIMIANSSTTHLALINIYYKNHVILLKREIEVFDTIITLFNWLHFLHIDTGQLIRIISL